jgi:hypothetical protein
VARELLGARPLDEIGLMKVVADTTLTVLCITGSRCAALGAGRIVYNASSFAAVSLRRRRREQRLQSERMHRWYTKTVIRFAMIDCNFLATDHAGEWGIS